MAVSVQVPALSQALQALQTAYYPQIVALLGTLQQAAQHPGNLLMLSNPLGREIRRRDITRDSAAVTTCRAVRDAVV
jgi:hypothetical protein